MNKSRFLHGPLEVTKGMHARIHICAFGVFISLISLGRKTNTYRTYCPV
jgi:hypothetical protein